ncbi:hypothetical protein PROFUN_09377 [Planoprotostelium fungivorum]|uniref:F-box domain-containing protein n=1 Tax=Planoprotostelium fungivorum TaxID=1890364 RepID=A0A2P6NGY0_9EUKA|nr:hypothetical protein PROFUN_09377 [Planoprotostelium fungivorum]
MRILQLLEAPALSKCLRVCKRWNRIASDGSIWRKLCLRLIVEEEDTTINIIPIEDNRQPEEEDVTHSCPKSLPTVDDITIPQNPSLIEVIHHNGPKPTDEIRPPPRKRIKLIDNEGEDISWELKTEEQDANQNWHQRYKESLRTSIREQLRHRWLQIKSQEKLMKMFLLRKSKNLTVKDEFVQRRRVLCEQMSEFTAERRRNIMRETWTVEAVRRQFSREEKYSFTQPTWTVGDSEQLSALDSLISSFDTSLKTLEANIEITRGKMEEIREASKALSNRIRLFDET